MSDQSTKWDKQWSELLTRCHGKDVTADTGFKAGLLAELKSKTAENRHAAPETTQDDDANWGKLLKAAYVPCHPEEDFKAGLLAQLKAKQQDTAVTTPAVTEDEGLRIVLTKSYQPVAPRKEFETRLLENLKERQRSATQVRVKSRRRTFYLSMASSVAAAAMVMFVVWLAPVGGNATPSTPARSGDLHLTVPDTDIALASPVRQAQPVWPTTSTSGTVFASLDSAPAAEPSAWTGIEPAVFETVPASFTTYRAADAFSGNPLPAEAFALQNVEMNDGDGWKSVDETQSIELRPGDAFRAGSGMGHLKFSDGTLLSISPDTILNATAEGLMVAQGFLLVAVPSTSQERFRLHFTERDIAVEPGTDLAVMVEPADKFAEGGAPAPMVMVVASKDNPGGLALARGKTGIGPLFASQLYRLDNYVTADLPSRTLCDTECQDLSKMFNSTTVVEPGIDKALFAGGFAGDRELSNYATVLTPAGFAKKGNRWIADSYGNEQTVQLKYLSDAYFGFANERRDLARELSLGAGVVIDGGDGSFYEIVR